MFQLRSLAKSVLTNLLDRLTDGPASPPATVRPTPLRVIEGGKSPAKVAAFPPSCHDTSASSRAMG